MDSLPVAIRGDIDEILEENPFSSSLRVRRYGGRKNKFLLTDDEKLKNNVENNLLNNNANLLKV